MYWGACVTFHACSLRNGIWPIRMFTCAEKTTAMQALCVIDDSVAEGGNDTRPTAIAYLYESNVCQGSQSESLLLHNVQRRRRRTSSRWKIVAGEEVTINPRSEEVRSLFEKLNSRYQRPTVTTYRWLLPMAQDVGTNIVYICRAFTYLLAPQRRIAL